MTPLAVGGSPATMPGFHAGRPPRHKGHRYPADTPTVDEIVAVMRGLSHTRASLTIARKLARRSFHALRALGPAALDPTPTT